VATDAGSRAPGPPDADARRASLRALPSVEELAASLHGVPHALAVRAAREAVDARREALLGGGGSAGGGPARGGGSPGGASAGDDLPDLRADALARAAAAERPSLRAVVNATGVIVHTNLGRAPLAPAALDAIRDAAGGYSTLEYDLEAGTRGSRHAHVEELLRSLTGAEAAIAVNNCASAVLLAAAALAGGRDLVVSRGQLVEIGGSFRIPDVVSQSGARLVEVGTTNRTRLADYERALGPDTGAVMRAHQSNFRTVGFVEEVEVEDLCEAAARTGVPVIDDVGSGALAERLPELADEPPVRRSVAAGCAVVCFSGDKLLGGPQAGLMVGTREAIDRCRSHPLARAVRIDKLSLAALEATLRLYLDPARALREVPVLRMLAAGADELRARAELMRIRLEAAGVASDVIVAAGKVGGGALPLLELEGPVCAVDPAGVGLDELARRLRAGEPPVVARAREGWLLLDPRTLTDAEAVAAADAVVAALA
jgi:L-seryl-tRNA(Ser) seleniumtransferase